MATKKSDDKMGQSRQQIGTKIEEQAAGIVSDILNGTGPSIAIPVRGSRNVEFDKENKKIVLGDKIAHRYLFNTGHARKFMQTMLVASYVKKDLLENNLTATLRDLYYAKKHTIAGTKEDTIDEQKESDLAIVDFEVSLDTFREKLNLRAEPKGRMAGSVVLEDRVRNKVDSIDLSHMGSGGWAVPSIVEQIEFKKVDVDYVLVAEKNAIFDRLNEDEYWAKNNCLIMTTAGQAARGARRLLQRLNEELKLPVYILSIDGNEPIVVVDDDGFISNPRIKKYVDEAMAVYGIFDGGYYERSIGGGNALQVSPDGKTSTGRIANTVRHPIFEDLYEVTGEAGYSARVTASQSLMVFDAGKFAIVPKAAKELVDGDYLVCPSKVPNNERLEQLNLLELIDAKAPELKDNVQILVNGKFVSLREAGKNIDPAQNQVLRHGKSELRFGSIVPVSPELCRLLGYFAAEGSSTHSCRLTFGSHETVYVADAVRCAEKVFGNSARVNTTASSPTATTVDFGGLFMKEILLKLLEAGCLAENKQVPPAIFNVPNAFKLEFLRGYFRGDGNLRFSERGAKLWASTVSRKLASDLILLIHQLGGWATVNKKPVRSKMRLEAYHVCISDRKTLQRLSDVVMDLSGLKAGAVKEYLSKQPNKLSVQKTIPSALLKPVQKEFYRLTRRGLSPLVNNQVRIAFEKLEPLFERFVNGGESILHRDRALSILPPVGGSEPAVKTAEVARLLGIKFTTAFKSLSRLERNGFAAREKRAGDCYWRRIKDNPVDREAKRKLAVLKNLVDDNVVLLKVKKLEKVAPTTDWVYDIEVFPTHTFVGGLGGLQLKNTDADPYGWYIYSTMKYGSMALAHESDRLGCPNANFIGMSISDIEHYDLKAVTIKAKEVDIKRAEEMKKYDWFKSKEWQSEINKFLDKKIKAEIQSLSSKNLQYISKTYLPEKINNKDFLP